MNNTTLMEQQEFLLPTIEQTAGEFTNEELAEDMDGLQMSFPRAKIPAGGSIQFEIPSNDPDNPDYTKTLVGVILYNHAAGAYWPAENDSEEKTPPLCSSVNGKTGIGEPGGDCTQCALNRYGSGADGKGKACKNMRMLYLLRSGEIMPLQLALPPTSLKPFREFMNQAFSMRRRATYGSLVQISLKKASNGSNEYSVASFSRIYDFEGEGLAMIRNYASSFKEQIKMMLEQRAATAAEQRDTGCDYEPMTSLPAGEGQSFCIAPQQIDGDREALPA